MQDRADTLSPRTANSSAFWVQWTKFPSISVSRCCSVSAILRSDHRNVTSGARVGTDFVSRLYVRHVVHAGGDAPYHVARSPETGNPWRGQKLTPDGAGQPPPRPGPPPSGPRPPTNIQPLRPGNVGAIPPSARRLRPSLSGYGPDTRNHAMARFGQGNVRWPLAGQHRRRRGVPLQPVARLRPGIRRATEVSSREPSPIDRTRRSGHPATGRSRHG